MAVSKGMAGEPESDFLLFSWGSLFSVWAMTGFPDFFVFPGLWPSVLVCASVRGGPNLPPSLIVVSLSRSGGSVGLSGAHSSAVCSTLGYHPPPQAEFQWSSAWGLWIY